MIVKNEAHVIQRCLRSVRPFIDSYSISDTGSTDDTMELIRMELAGLPGILTSDPWQDFGTNRQIALNRSVGDYVLFIDADETLECNESILHLPSGFDCFYLRVVQDNTEFWRPIIVRNDPMWRWVGTIHETITFDGLPTGLKLEHCRIHTHNDSSRNQSGDKFLNDLAVLQTAPRTAQNTFYRAQSLRGLSRFEESLSLYEQVPSLGGRDDVAYHALHLAAKLRAYLPGEFHERVAAYFRAYIFRPHRMDALVDLCLFLRENGRVEQAYVLSNVEPRPTEDLSFLDRSAEWRILEEHGLAAYYLDKFEEARVCFLRVAAHDLPVTDRQRTLDNLGYCDTKLGAGTM